MVTGSVQLAACCSVLEQDSLCTKSSFTLVPLLDSRGLMSN